MFKGKILLIASSLLLGTALTAYNTNLTKVNATTSEEMVYSYSLKSGDFSTTKTETTLNNVKWNVGITWSTSSKYIAFDNDKGAHFGSGTKYFSKMDITLSSENFQNVNKVIINTCGAKGTNASLEVKVGNDVLGNKVNLTTYDSNNVDKTSYTFTNGEMPSLNGNISLHYNQTSEKAIYLKSISVYTKANTTPETPDGLLSTLSTKSKLSFNYKKETVMEEEVKDTWYLKPIEQTSNLTIDNNPYDLLEGHLLLSKDADYQNSLNISEYFTSISLAANGSTHLYCGGTKTANTSIRLYTSEDSNKIGGSLTFESKIKITNVSISYKWLDGSEASRVGYVDYGENIDAVKFGTEEQECILNIDNINSTKLTIKNSSKTSNQKLYITSINFKFDSEKVMVEKVKYSTSNLKIRLGALVDYQNIWSKLSVDSYGVYAATKESIDSLNITSLKTYLQDNSTYSELIKNVSTTNQPLRVDENGLENANGNFVMWNVIVNVPEVKYSADIYAVAYVKLTDGKFVYLNEKVTSPTKEAEYYLSQENTDLSEDVINALKTIK